MHPHMIISMIIIIIAQLSRILRILRCLFSSGLAPQRVGRLRRLAVRSGMRNTAEQCGAAMTQILIMMTTTAPILIMMTIRPEI